MRKFAFLHLPKTGGTSFTNALAATRTVTPPFEPNDRIPSNLAKELDTFDIVAGHLSHDDYDHWFSERSAFTVLRDPIERCLSWYWFCRNVVPIEVTAPEVASAKHLDPEQYFSQDRSIIFRISMNGQCRQLGGHLNFCGSDDRALMARAMANLRKMVWVGFSETLDADIERLRRLPEFSGLPAIGRVNTANRDHPVSTAVREIISRNNQCDLELYEFGMSLMPPRTEPKSDL
jgi:Sulfotransferase family